MLEQELESLEKVWEEHRDGIRRLLIYLTRDIDLADDLLQETYLSARSGFKGFKGDNPRAWFTTIAKNVFLMHKRKRYIRAEVALDDEVVIEDTSVPGSPGHLGIIDINRALDNLSPTLRDSLVLKHYGGLTYEEIAGKLGCSVGTAKWRVSVALKDIRTALGTVERGASAMKCEGISDRMLLDYIYNRLSTTEVVTIEKHLQECESCRQRVEEIRNVLRALDEVETVHKSTSMIELDEHGTVTGYVFMTFTNSSEESMETLDFKGGPNMNLTYLALQGEEVEVEVGETDESDMREYRAHLPHPVKPGGNVEMLVAGSPLSGPKSGSGADYLGDGTWRLGPGGMHLTEKSINVIAMRLPAGADLLKATPEPSEMHRNGAVTIIWKNVLPENEEFNFWVEYKL